MGWKKPVVFINGVFVGRWFNAMTVERGFAQVDDGAIRQYFPTGADRLTLSKGKPGFPNRTLTVAYYERDARRQTRRSGREVIRIENAMLVDAITVRIESLAR